MSFLKIITFVHHRLRNSDVLVATLLTNDHIVKNRPRYKGSVDGRVTTLNHNREGSMYNPIETISIVQTHFSGQYFPTTFPDGETCVQSYSAVSGGL